MKNDIYEVIQKYKKSVDEYLNEGQDHSNYKAENAIPYTNQDEILGETLDSARELFGANFSNVKDPMLYYPASENGVENVSLSGEIGLLNDAKFQFWMKDENNAGCIISCNLLTLNKETVNLLGVVYGAYDTWKHNLLRMGDIKPMTFHGNGESKQMVPGDDFGSNEQ